jgi:tetratricopeptide (TPR) repeat protein
MTCEQISNGEIVERYLRDDLGEDAREAFEQHYFACDRCFALLQTLRDVQSELAGRRAEILSAAVGRPWIWRWGWLPATAVVVLAASVVLVQRQADVELPLNEAGRSTGVDASPQPPAVVRPPVPTLAELARVEPPEYSPGRLRGVTDEAAARYEAAMKQYQQRNYIAAVTGLSAAARLDADAPHIQFFLGISRLMAGQPDAAIESLGRTIALGDSPFIEEAHYFLAKSYLQLGDVRGADRELTQTIELRGEREAEAQQLRDQLRRLAERPQ